MIDWLIIGYFLVLAKVADSQFIFLVIAYFSFRESQRK